MSTATKTPGAALARSRTHLVAHRRLIVLRSLLSGLAAMTPVPLLDDILAARVRRQTIRRIAEARRVDVTAEAVLAVADGRVAPPGLKTLLSASLVPRLISRSARKALILVTAAQRADEALRTFAVATLFDHYCATLHVGAGLDGPRAKQLRADIDDALTRAPSRVALRLFRRGLVASAKAVLAVPGEIFGRASDLVLRRLGRGSGDAEGEADVVVEDAVAHAERHGAIGRVTAAIEAAMDAASDTYLDDIVSAFEARHAERA
jgi:hypothetical protein